MSGNPINQFLGDRSAFMCRTQSYLFHYFFFCFFGRWISFFGEQAPRREGAAQHGSLSHKEGLICALCDSSLWHGHLRPGPAPFLQPKWFLGEFSCTLAHTVATHGLRETKKRGGGAEMGNRLTEKASLKQKCLVLIMLYILGSKSPLEKVNYLWWKRRQRKYQGEWYNWVYGAAFR